MKQRDIFKAYALWAGGTWPSLTVEIHLVALPVQQTSLQALTSRAGMGLLGQLRRSWRSASLAILALLCGFTSPRTSPPADDPCTRGQAGAALAMLLVVEVMVRLRSRWLRDPPATGWVPTGWVVADNLRVGAIYSVVLEALKLGS